MMQLIENDTNRSTSVTPLLGSSCAASIDAEPIKNSPDQTTPSARLPLTRNERPPPRPDSPLGSSLLSDTNTTPRLTNRSATQHNNNNKDWRLQLIEAQNDKLLVEVELHKKLADVNSLAVSNRQLQEELLNSRANTMKLLHMFETEAKTAEKRISELSQELVKAQELSRRYQNTMELMCDQASQSQGPDITHNERQMLQTLTAENENLKREVARLRSENCALMTRVKRAEDEKAQAMNMYFTSQASRDQLMKKLQKSDQQQKSLNETLNRNTTEWISKKRELRNLQEEIRWNLVNDTPAYNTELGKPSQLLQRRNVYVPRRLQTPRPISAAVHHIM